MNWEIYWNIIIQVLIFLVLVAPLFIMLTGWVIRVIVRSKKAEPKQDLDITN